MDKSKALNAIEQFRKDSIICVHSSQDFATSNDISYLISAIEKLAISLINAID